MAPVQVRLDDEWAQRAAGAQLAHEHERLTEAVDREDDERITEALVRAWMMGAQAATVELFAQLVEAGVDATVSFDVVLPDGDWDTDGEDQIEPD